METFNVFGKLKRKELSFGFNNVRGVNKREERLLRSALGSLEKQRIRSLVSIQNEVEDLHITLKETNNIWPGDRHIVHDQVEIQVHRCQTPIINEKRAERPERVEMIEKQSSIKENLEGTSMNQKEMSEPNHQGPRLVPGSSLQHLDMSNSSKIKTHERVLNRPRNTSTGSIPKNLHQETAHATLDLRKTASNSDVHKLVNRASTNVTPTGAMTLISDEVAQDKIFYKRHHQKSASTENITCSREKLTTAPFLSPQIRQKKLSTDLGSFSSISSSPTNSPIRTRKLGTARSLNSFANTNVESSPIMTRRATVTENSKRMSRSAVGHKPITRMISCPQLNCSQATHDYRTLSSMSGERSLSRMSTELPELITGTKMHDDKRDDTEHNYRCVSPNNLERTMMDKNLQTRINAFLNSLSDDEARESGTCAEETE